MIIGEWKKTREEFERKELILLRKMMKFIATMEVLGEKRMFEQMNTVKRINELKFDWTNYLNQLLNRVSGEDIRDVAYLSRAWTVPYALEEMTNMLDGYQENITDILLTKFPILDKQIKLGNEINKRLDEFLVYLRERGLIKQEDVKMAA